MTIIINKIRRSLLSCNSPPKTFISFLSFLIPYIQVYKKSNNICRRILSEALNSMTRTQQHIATTSVYPTYFCEDIKRKSVKKAGNVPPQQRIRKLIFNHINHTRFNYGTKRLSILDCEATAEQKKKKTKEQEKFTKNTKPA